MEKKPISFLDAFPLTCYLEYFKNILADFILEKFDHDNSSRYFLYVNQGNKKIFLLHKKLKVIYAKRNYEVPILMYFPKNFPNTPPEIYLEKRSNNLEINLELNQLKNELLRKLNLIAQVHKNEKSLKEIERKSKEDYQKIYKDMKIGDYSIVDKCESILTIFNPKTLKRHVNEIMLQDLLREIKRGLEKKNISFQDALINYRTISREIFYIQRIQEMHPDE